MCVPTEYLVQIVFHEHALRNTAIDHARPPELFQGLLKGKK